MILKMMAFGLFFKENSYFRNKWNFLDFGVVISIYFYRFFNIFISVDLSTLRNLIILRLIKLSAFQIILDKLFFAFILLLDTFLIIMILLFICSLIGVQLFLGLLKFHCMDPLSGIFDDYSFVCGSKTCESGYICAKSLVNPDSGVTNYDNIFFGLIQTLRLITLDNWTDLQALLQNAFSEQAWIYSFAIVALGNFFIINLMLAVLKVKYSECNPDTMNQIKVYLKKYQEKTYNLQDLRAQGFYKKNKATGIRVFGMKKRLTSFFSGNKKMNVKEKIGKNFFSSFNLKSFNFSKIMKPSFFLDITKKTFGFLSKNKLEEFFHKTKMITMKEKAAELSGKNIEIRVDHSFHYISDSIEDVLPLKYILIIILTHLFYFIRKNSDLTEKFQRQLYLRKKIKIKNVFHIAFVSDDNKILKEMVSRKKTRKNQKKNMGKPIKKRNRLPLRASRLPISLPPKQRKIVPKKIHVKREPGDKNSLPRLRRIAKDSTLNGTLIIAEERKEEDNMLTIDFTYSKLQKIINEKFQKNKLEPNDLLLEEMEYFQILV